MKTCKLHEEKVVVACDAEELNVFVFIEECVVGCFLCSNRSSCSSRIGNRV